jgi:hypothetical protein
VERINQWLTFVANLGVIAGIVFLGYEIHQNTEQLKSASLRDMASRMEDRMLLVATDSDLARRIMYLHDEPESLTDLDEFHLLWFVGSWVADFEEAYRQFELGTIPEAALASRAINMKRWLETPLGQFAWDEATKQGDPGFVRWANALMNEEVPAQRDP